MERMNRYELFAACFLSVCIWARGFGQSVEVSLSIDSYSPVISKYSETQMERMLLDSVIRHSHSWLLKLGRNVDFYPKGDTGEHDKPTYRLELRVVDSLCDTGARKDVCFLKVFGAFIEAEMPRDNGKSWGHFFGGSYDTKQSDSEARAIDIYVSCAKVEAEVLVRWSLPLSLTESFAPRNVFAKDDLDRLEFFSEMIVRIDTVGIRSSNKNDLDRLVVLISNSFFRKQHRVSMKRSLDGGKSQFNYYATAEPMGYSGQTVSGNPIDLKLVIEREGPSDYRITLVFDEQKYSYNDYFGKSLKERSIRVPIEILRKTPSKINFEIINLIEPFVNSNSK